MCCTESTKDFSDGLKKCESTCGNSDQKQNFQRDEHKIHTACFQRDGTWHISLWQGQLSTKNAKTIIDRCHNKNINRIPITHVQFTKRWNNWKAGNYLGLDKSTTTDPLRVLTAFVLTALWRAVEKNGSTRRRVAYQLKERKRSRCFVRTLLIKDFKYGSSLSLLTVKIIRRRTVKQPKYFITIITRHVSSILVRNTYSAWE